MLYVLIVKYETEKSFITVATWPESSSRFSPAAVSASPIGRMPWSRGETTAFFLTVFSQGMTSNDCLRGVRRSCEEMKTRKILFIEE
jgi:hypothetical protein